MKTITLKDGSLKHTLPGWIGYQAVGDSMAKTKWTNLRLPTPTNEWRFEASERSKKAGFTEWVVTAVGDKLQCDCGGFRWTRNCKHTKQVRKEIGV